MRKDMLSADSREETTFELIYEGRGFSGSIDMAPWFADLDHEDVQALMKMWTGIPFQESPYGIQEAYRKSTHSEDEPHTLIFRDQTALLSELKKHWPLLWEAASGSTLRCNDTIDMYGEDDGRIT